MNEIQIRWDAKASSKSVFCLGFHATGEWEILLKEVVSTFDFLLAISFIARD